MQTTVRFGEAARNETGDISSDRPTTAAALAPKLRNDRRDLCLTLCKVSPLLQIQVPSLANQLVEEKVLGS